ncbi:MAG: cupin domain-containing protein [Dinoroseobacter sp.]|nr:cupin domain-containing protein [Dinoroseobacter sp.]
MTADDIIERLQLQPHPEGGFYRQTWIADAPDGERPAGTAIYFLLRDGGASHWHKVDASEIWLWHAGAPLILSVSETDEGPATDMTLSGDLSIGLPQGVVPKDWWQAARTTGDWTLVSCTVSPAFQFAGFELASPDFDIPRVP